MEPDFVMVGRRSFVDEQPCTEREGELESAVHYDNKGRWQSLEDEVNVGGETYSLTTRKLKRAGNQMRNVTGELKRPDSQRLYVTSLCRKKELSVDALLGYTPKPIIDTIPSDYRDEARAIHILVREMLTSATFDSRDAVSRMCKNFAGLSGYADAHAIAVMARYH